MIVKVSVVMLSWIGIVLTGCGYRTEPGSALSAISNVTVSCRPTLLQMTQSSQCSAAVSGSGSYKDAVVWTATGGTISASGSFKPNAVGNATITATSTENGSKTGAVSLAVAPTGVNNLTPSNLPKWQAALTSVLSEKRRATIACVGDSTTAGIGSSSRSAFTNIKAESWPTQMAVLLTSAGIPAHSASFFADSGVGSDVSLEQADPRLTLDSDWGVNSSYPTIGGTMLANPGTISALTFNPGILVDTADIYDLAPSGNVTWSVGFDGESTSSPETGTFRKTTITTSAAPHTITLQPSGAGAVFLVGMDTYDSTHKDIAVWNMGYSGSASGQWTGNTNSYDALSVLKTMAPDLTIIDLGINDMDHGVSVSHYQANITKIIQAAQSSGDVILVVPDQVNPANLSPTTQDSFRSVLYVLASQFDLPILDIPQILGDYSDANLAGLMFDQAHPNERGYARIATAMKWLVAYQPVSR